MTKPKPLFTEATLLAAMENASNQIENEAHREAIKGCGIGTPATRASIIETLFKRGYMERVKKNLVPTEKGLQLYKAVKNLQIADVALTGDWESKLLRIEQEPDFRHVFAEEIREYTKRVVDEISSADLPANGRTFDCPKCKSGKITVYAKVAKCGNGSCNLTVFRTLCGKNLTDNQITDLLSNGKTAVIKGFRGKSGKTYDAALKFDDNFRIVLDFVDRKPQN
jgi:DNA topoisomerase-3